MVALPATLGALERAGHLVLRDPAEPSRDLKATSCFSLTSDGDYTGTQVCGLPPLPTSSFLLGGVVADQEHGIIPHLSPHFHGRASVHCAANLGGGGPDNLCNDIIFSVQESVLRDQIYGQSDTQLFVSSIGWQNPRKQNETP